MTPHTEWKIANIVQLALFWLFIVVTLVLSVVIEAGVLHCLWLYLPFFIYFTSAMWAAFKYRQYLRYEIQKAESGSNISD